MEIELVRERTRVSLYVKLRRGGNIQLSIKSFCNRILHCPLLQNFDGGDEGDDGGGSKLKQIEHDDDDGGGGSKLKQIEYGGRLLLWTRKSCADHGETRMASGGVIKTERKI